jgi:uncharacterized repeat protein (TIGR02543 family)
MNKKTLYVSVICFLVSLFLACNMQGPEPEPTGSGYDGKAAVRIHIGVNGIQERTVRPTGALQEVSAWELRGRRQGGEETLLAEFSSPEEETIDLDPGTWSFTLKGYKNSVNDGAVILTGSITEQTISLEGTKTLSFTVAPAVEGEGTVSLTIELPAGSGITSAQVFKDWTDLGTPLALVDNRIVFTRAYDAGVYYFSIRLFKDTELYGAVSESVYVWPNLTSAKTYALTMADLDLTYIISYHIEDGRTETDYYQQTDAAVTLAPPSRQGYIFTGWYDNADFSGDAVAEIPAGSTGNKDFYAKWISTQLSNYTLAEALALISAYAEEGVAYTIILHADESLDPQTLSYSNKTISIALDGGMAERTISLSSSGALFTVESGVTLTLGSNITLQGLSDNTDALVKVNSDAVLEMNAGSKITGNTSSTASSSRGGGVYVSSSGTFTMNGGDISGNSSSYGGGVYVSSSGTFTMNNGDISGNSTSAYGGGVRVEGTFTMNGGDISSNSASWGGGVYITSSATFTMNNGDISDNTATTGGGVYVYSGTFTMDGGDISDNTATTGGGVYVRNNSKFFMNAGNISNNSANSGGGVYIADSGTFTMSNGTISNNTASIDGGGVYASGSTFTMSGGTVNGNTATSSKGGGVFLAAGTFTMSGGTISGNSISGNDNYGNNYGGGVYVYYGTFTMSGGEISGNSAINGAGVYMNSSGTFTMNSGSKISGNIAANYGGGVYNSSGTFTMSGGDISGNSANYGGGVLVYYGGTFTMSGGDISGNSANYGGGVYVYNGTFTKESGGVIYGSNASEELKNSASGDGHAVYVDGSPVKLRNTTVGESATLDSAQSSYAGGWEEQWLITFNADGGEPATQTLTVTNGNSAGTMPSEPMRSNYMFGGWYTETSGNGTPFTATTPVTGDITVYANWQHIITFDADGGEPATQTRMVNTGMPSEPTRDGYNFGGWFTQKNGGNSQFTTDTLVTENITVYALWLLPAYSVHISMAPTPDDPPLSYTSLFVNKPALFDAGSGYVSYVWCWDGEKIPGATSSTYTLEANTKTSETYELSVLVTTSTGEILSARCRVDIKAN